MLEELIRFISLLLLLAGVPGVARVNSQKTL